MNDAPLYFDLIYLRDEDLLEELEDLDEEDLLLVPELLELDREELTPDDREDLDDPDDLTPDDREDLDELTPEEERDDFGVLEVP